MPYIDFNYYTTEYKGAEIDETTFDQYARRASELIDQVTNDVLYGQEFTQIAQFLQEKVKLATAAQVEFYVEKDGYIGVDTGTDGELSNVTIGPFSYQDGNSSDSSISNGKQANRVSPAALAHLRRTGLLYSGIGVV